jgi:phosphoglycerol transferase MdoB-like AlkP superfamily enzyme
MRLIKKLLFLKPVISFLFIGLAILTLFRLYLLVEFNDRVLATNNFWLIFPIGLRMDLIALCYLLFLPTILILFIPDKHLRRTQPFLLFYFILFLVVILFLELATPTFIGQFDTRPNQLFIDYLIYPKEVVGMLLKGFLFSVIGVFFLLVLFGYMIWRYRIPLFEIKSQNFKIKLMLAPIVLFLLFFGARSSLTSVRPINASNAIFSNDQLTNSLGLNSFYTVAYAAYSWKNESNVVKMYGKMNYDEAISRVEKYMTAEPNDFIEPVKSLQHHQHPEKLADHPYNLVIILEESLGADYVGCLGGLPLTPEFDKLTKEGLLFSNLYCTGTRSVRGIEAVVTGFLPTPSESVVKLSNSQTGFYTIASLLKSYGYATSFVYGGSSNFDNMGSFFNGNGFDVIIDEDDFDPKTSVFHGNWGWSDEDLMTRAISHYKSTKQPFMSLIFSSSNHEPFEFPNGRIEDYDSKHNTVNNAIKYADFCIGKFFDLAKKENFYKNTIFVVIADHNTRTYGKHLVPINKFHIPALIIGPNIPKGSIYSKLCSQIDIQPTLLEEMGMDVTTPMPGRNLLNLKPAEKGRAIMQFYDINAFRIEDDVVILQPNHEPQQFHVVHDTTFIPEPVDSELAKDALAHLITASYLYKEKKYSVSNH